MDADVSPLTVTQTRLEVPNGQPHVDDIIIDAAPVAFEPGAISVAAPPTADQHAYWELATTEALSDSAMADSAFDSDAAEQGTDTPPSPYLDYDRRFTPEGGIAITYKTVDDRLWRLLVRVALWLIFLGLIATYAFRHSPYPALPSWCPLGGPCRGQLPVLPLLLNLVVLGGMAWLSFLILFPEDQCLREIEIRPDCLILDGTDLFWRQHFELAWPSFGHGENGMLILRGTYGTRQVEFLSLKAFDENDHAAQVLGAHIQAAFQQLWAPPHRR